METELGHSVSQTHTVHPQALAFKDSGIPASILFRSWLAMSDMNR